MASISVGGSGLTTAQAASLITPGLQSGTQVISLPLFGIGNTTAAMVADTKYGHPIFVPQACVCIGIQMVVGTSVAGVLGKVALYSMRTRGLAGSLLAEAPNTIDLNAAGNTVLQSDFSASIPLTPGWYVPACKFNGAAQPISVQTTAPALISAAFYFGAPNLTSWVRNGTGAYTKLTVAEAYANAFATDGSTMAPAALAPGAPLMGLVVTV
jgi:hypothetical protein